MGYKITNSSSSFVDITLSETLKHNRSLQNMDKLNKSIDWEKIKSILSCHYTPGTSNEGASAYHPILLYKCLLLQKWLEFSLILNLKARLMTVCLLKDFSVFHLKLLLLIIQLFQDSEQGFQKKLWIRLTVKSCASLKKQGLTINEGIAVDARLVKSASSPVSSDQVKKNKENKHIPKTDKNDKPVKFSRDIESDWTVKNDKPHYGLKEHASVDVNHGFILATTLTPASVNDTNYLEYCTLYSRHTSREITKVYADKGYAGAPNRKFLSLNKIADGIMRKNSTTAKLTDFEKERNKKLSKKRYIVEQYFGLSHLNDNASRARFTTIAKNKFDIWMRQAAYNILKGVRILSKPGF
jgi:IS5 family transposase